MSVVIHYMLKEGLLLKMMGEEGKECYGYEVRRCVFLIRLRD